MPAKDQNQFLRSVGIYRDWPDARLIYKNGHQAIDLVVNEEDHVKLSITIENK